MRWMMVQLLIVAACVLGNAGCDRSQGPTEKKLLIAVTVFPVANLLDQLVGDWAEVRVLLPGTGTEGNPKLSDESLATLGKADVLIVGGTTDAWVEAKARQVGRNDLEVLRFIDLVKPPAATRPTSAPGSDGVGAVTCPWMDLLLADRFVAVIGARLEPMFPDRKTPLGNRVLLMRTNILLLHQEYEYKFGELRNRKRVIVGDGSELITRRYGLELVAAGMPVLTLDPVGGAKVEGYTTYLEMMKSNLKMVLDNRGK